VLSHALAWAAPALAYRSDLLVFGAGLVVGFISGLIGGGGSVLAVPLLVYLVGLRPHLAIGTSAVAVAVSAFASLLGHARHGYVKWNCAIVFALAGTGGAMIGSLIGKEVDGQRLLAFFGVMMIAIAATMFSKKNFEGNPAVKLNRVTAPRMAPGILAYGAGAGALSGFFGISGGVLVVPGIIAATGMPLISAIGSSLVSMTAFAMITALNYALSGLVDWPMAGVCIAGGVFGGLFGTRAARAFAKKKRALAQVFAVVVAAVGLYVTAKGFGLG
jgi:uncharacterized protein